MHGNRMDAGSGRCIIEKNNIYIYITFGIRGVWVQLLGGLGTCVCVILVLRECIWNAPVILLVLPAFDSVSSLGSPLHQGLSP